MYSDSAKFNRPNSLIGDISDYMEHADFRKLADFEGEYNPGEMSVKGWVMFKDKFAPETASGLDKVNVYLVCQSVLEPASTLFVRLPKSLAKKLVEDFEKEVHDNGMTIENYVSDIKTVRTYKTKFGTKSATFETYE